MPTPDTLPSTKRKRDATHDAHKITNAAARINDRVGYLVYAGSNGNNVLVSPAQLTEKLENGPHPHLSMLLPRPASAHVALTRASKQAKPGKGYEWKDLGYDAQQERVMLLCAISASADAQDYEARKVAAALVKTDGTLETATMDPAFEGTMEQLKQHYQIELGMLGQTELWRIVDAIARKGGSFLRVKEGLLFVSTEARGSRASSYEYLVEFDRALKELNCPYRLRMIPFRGEDASVIATDVSVTFMEEFQTLVRTWNERKDKAAASGRSMRRDGAETTVEELENLHHRYETLRGTFAYLNEEFEKASTEMRAEALRAAGLAL